MAIIIACLVLIATVFLLWKVPVWQLRTKRQSLKQEDYLGLENEYRKTIAEITGGVFVLIGLAFTWYQLSATQDAIAISRETLITDRYSKAIDQLGEAKSQTRLGGIFALGKIAEQSKEYISIVDNVLASYIRQSNTDSNVYVKDEIQSAVMIITARNTHPSSESENNNKIQLTSVKLTSLNFNNGVLTGADLSNTDFSNSSFVNTDLSLASAYESTFTNCNFTDASLAKAMLYGSHLKEAVLKRANLTQADLRLSDLREVDCTGCNFSGADLSEAKLEGAILLGADLTSAKGLTASQLSKARTDNQTKMPSLKQ